MKVASVGCALLAIVTAGCSGRPEVAPSPDGAGAWVAIAGGPGTGCARDSAFAFFVHSGRSRHLAIYFEGGGACWNAGNCDLEGRPTFDPQVDARDHPSRAGGILDLSDPRNPIRDFSIVFVPYCTGDVFLGSRTATYTVPAAPDAPERSYRIRHRGSTNTDFVLDWVFAHFPEPDLVFVTGSSAGAIATPLDAVRIARSGRAGDPRALGRHRGAAA